MPRKRCLLFEAPQTNDTTHNILGILDLLCHDRSCAYFWMTERDPSYSFHKPTAFFFQSFLITKHIEFPLISFTIRIKAESVIQQINTVKTPREIHLLSSF